MDDDRYLITPRIIACELLRLSGERGSVYVFQRWDDDKQACDIWAHSPKNLVWFKATRADLGLSINDFNARVLAPIGRRLGSLVGAMPALDTPPGWRAAYASRAE